MDIELLSKMVKELLLNRDSVELPGLGTFVAVNMPAAFSDRGFTINPPYRKLNFLPGEHASDGMLTELYATSNDIGESDAEAILRRFFNELKDVLQQEKILVFPSLGVLKLARNNVTLFVPDEDLDISPEFYGLSAISLKSNVKAANSRHISLSLPDELTRPESAPNYPAATPEPAAAATPEPAAEPAPAAEAMPELSRPVYGYGKRKEKHAWLIPVYLVVFFFAALAIFLLMAHFCPDVIDKLLYSKEDLMIIHTDIEYLL